jgi:hypothetical protein
MRLIEVRYVQPASAAALLISNRSLMATSAPISSCVSARSAPVDYLAQSTHAHSSPVPSLWQSRRRSDCSMSWHRLNTAHVGCCTSTCTTPTAAWKPQRLPGHHRDLHLDVLRARRRCTRQRAQYLDVGRHERYTYASLSNMTFWSRRNGVLLGRVGVHGGIRCGTRDLQPLIRWLAKRSD